LGFGNKNMFYSLETIFKEFCDYLDGKVKWSEKKVDLTKLIFEFFSKNIKEDKLVEKKEYMNLDYILRGKIPEYSTNDIVLAVEHEVSYRKPEDVISHEVQHLADIEAKYKIGIFYPSAGDEERLKEKIQKTISRASYLSVPWEEYLFVFGSPTTSGGKRSILFKAFCFTWHREGDYQNLETKQLKEMVIKQRSS